MGIYIKESDVQTRLTGKVRFTENPEDENKMSLILLKRLVSEAEGEVELDLSPRYMAPFQRDDGSVFSHLPDRPTQETLRTLCELKAVCRVLETDFGSGSVVDASKYKESQEKRYEDIKNKLVAVRDGSYNNFKFPPLPGLRLNYMNTEADDGFAGQVLTLNTGYTSANFADGRMNDPSQNYLNGRIDDEGCS